MTYPALSLPSHVSPVLATFVRGCIDEPLADIHFLLPQRRIEGLNDRFAHSIAALLFRLVDGLSQMIHPYHGSEGTKFIAFLVERYPWDLDPPRGCPVRGACAIFYDWFRNASTHRLSVINEQSQLVKILRMFNPDVDSIARSRGRPFSEPTFDKRPTAAVLLIDQFYWGVRIAVERSFATPESSQAIETWLSERNYVPQIAERNRKLARSRASTKIRL